MRKKIFITLMLALFGVSAFAQKQKYSISGELKGLTCDYIFLKQFIDNEYVTIDSSRVENDKFRFKGVVNNGVNFAGIFIPKVRGYITVFIEDGDICIDGDAHNIHGSKISGGEYSQAYKEVNIQSELLYAKSMEYLGKHHQANRNRDKDSSAYYLDKHLKAMKAQEQYIIDFKNRYRATPLGAYYFRMKDMRKASYKECVEFLSYFDEAGRFNNDYKAISAHTKLLSQIAEGEKLTDITLPDTTGKIFQLSMLKGKYVLVDFWASWCAPCRNEAKHLIEVYKHYSDCNFEILGISIDDNENYWHKAVADDSTPWLHVWDKGGKKYKDSFGISSIPRLMLIDPSGVVISNDIRGEVLRAKLKELFKK